MLDCLLEEDFTFCHPLYEDYQSWVCYSPFSPSLSEDCLSFDEWLDMREEEYCSSDDE